MKLIQIAIACCPECSAGYDLDELRELPELGRREKDDGAIFEVRQCRCGAEFSARVDGLEELELWRDAGAYVDSFGAQRAHRVVELSPRSRAFDRAALLVLAALAMLLWIAVVGLVLGIVAIASGWW